LQDEDDEEDYDEDCAAPMDSLHSEVDEDGDEDDDEDFTAPMDMVHDVMEIGEALEDAREDSELEEDEENGMMHGSGRAQTRSATAVMLSSWLRPRGLPSRNSLFRFTQWDSLMCTLPPAYAFLPLHLHYMRQAV
jgi:hypothetical protein